MRHEDSAEIEAEIRKNIATDIVGQKAHPWILEHLKAPDLHTLAGAVVTDLERRAQLLRSYSTAYNARSIADELDLAAQRLRQKMRSIEQSSGAIYDYAREVALAMSNLAMGCHPLRSVLDSKPQVAAVPSTPPEKAPPKRMGGRLPYAVKKPELGAGEPWQKYLIKRGPGRPRSTERTLTDEQNIAQAKQKLLLEKVRNSTSGGPSIRRVVRAQEPAKPKKKHG